MVALGTVDPTMDHEAQASQTGAPAKPASALELEALGVGSILRQLARDGQIVEVRCEMPQCYCFRGRRYFDPGPPCSDWSPTADHYPRLKMHGGLTPDNVRLGHTFLKQPRLHVAERLSLVEARSATRGACRSGR